MLIGAAFLGMIQARLKPAPAFAVTSTVLAGMVTGSDWRVSG